MCMHFNRDYQFFVAAIDYLYSVNIQVYIYNRLYVVNYHPPTGSSRWVCYRVMSWPKHQFQLPLPWLWASTPPQALSFGLAGTGQWRCPTHQGWGCEHWSQFRKSKPANTTTVLCRSQLSRSSIIAKLHKTGHLLSSGPLFCRVW